MGLRRKEVETLAKRELAPGSHVVRDGLSCWPAVKAGCGRFPTVTGAGQPAARWAPFRWVSTAQRQARPELSHPLRLPLPSAVPARLDGPVGRLAWAAASLCLTPARSSRRMRERDNQNRF
jgi:hypothetical protein